MIDVERIHREAIHNPDSMGAYFMPADHDLMLTDEEQRLRDGVGEISLLRAWWPMALLVLATWTAAAIVIWRFW